MEIVTPESSVGKEEVVSDNSPLPNQLMPATATRSCVTQSSQDGFWCLISMNDGVVIFTTNFITTALGFPKDMLIGRSFIDFVHPRDRSTFASQITSGLAAPKYVKGEEENRPSDPVASMFCRIRRYRGLSGGFGVKDKSVVYSPFLLKLSLKSMNEENGETVYLVIQATPFMSYFKVPNEVVTKAVPFVLRHSPLGTLEYVSPESVPFLGYLPQDLVDKDALQLYHPDDLPYLHTVYETIVREGAAPRSGPYRMLSQNGHFVELESEWSSFINPWSRKLEFVTGKHYTVEGPTNPDVFQSPDPDKTFKLTEEEKKKAQSLRESIVKTINEMLTKPAEVAKQQMSKRCQDLATFMEALMAEQTKTDEELRLEIQEPDNNYYERDSVMLGGISPHHDYNDGESSTETWLSYNQLNYKETLQRYFDSYQGRPCEDYQTPNDDELMLAMTDSPNNSSPICTLTEAAAAPDCAAPALRLTETVIAKHNLEIEKELVKKHREPRYCSKGDRDKAIKENRQKKKEHLARCNASFQPTAAGMPVVEPEPAQAAPHGVKRASRFGHPPARQKHHCASPRQLRGRKAVQAPQTFVEPPPQWGSQTYQMGVSTFIQDGRITQQMPVMGSVTTMPGMFPMYYMPTTTNPGLSLGHGEPPKQDHQQFQSHPVQYMMYPQPMFGSPFMYSPLAPQVAFPVPQTLVQQSTLQLNAHNAISMTTSSYDACKSTKARLEKQPPRREQWSEQGSSKVEQGSVRSSVLSAHTIQRSTEPQPESSCKKPTTDETADRTDESSHSSFYSSSFFKTESGSAEENSDNKAKKKDDNKQGVAAGYKPYQFQKVARRKLEPPWMEQVCVTSELIYKYQVLSKNVDEVLMADRRKIVTLEQPSLVNEQLGQLYIDLQLEGVAARLTLEEGITSSGSSGEENTSNSKLQLLKKTRRKREYSKLAMIYEEDAPLPSSPEDCKSS